MRLLFLCFFSLSLVTKNLRLAIYNSKFLSACTPVKKAVYDQILTTPELKSLLFQSAKARVLDDIVVIDGSDDTRSSDHLPTYVDFNYPNCGFPDLRIESLLPNSI